MVAMIRFIINSVTILMMQWHAIITVTVAACICLWVIVMLLTVA